jgi:hypothetical protein
VSSHASHPCPDWTGFNARHLFARSIAPPTVLLNRPARSPMNTLVLGGRCPSLHSQTKRLGSGVAGWLAAYSTHNMNFDRRNILQHHIRLLRVTPHQPLRDWIPCEPGWEWARAVGDRATAEHVGRLLHARQVISTDGYLTAVASLSSSVGAMT